MDDDLLQVDLTSIDEDEQALVNFNLSPVTVEALMGRGITKLFPIQSACLQPLLAGRDIVARAKTGSGKTLAFAIPIVEQLLTERPRQAQTRQDRPRSLVMCPTRELALQVEKEIQGSAPHARCVTVYGGAPIMKQVDQLRRGADLVVGTPGRIMDLLKRGSLDLHECGFVVLDEADMMLDMGFREDMDWILEQIPAEAERQTMLFSATMPPWVRRLSRTFLSNPVTVDLVGEDGTGKVSDDVTVLCVSVPRDEKRGLLPDLVSVHSATGKTIVFTQTKREADEVAAAVASTHPSEVLHGDIPQQSREVALQMFREGRVRVLVATDVAARGLDIPNVDLVIHFDLPRDQETFLHRSGRTGRAGNKGTAIVMFTPQERRLASRLMKDTQTPYANIGAPTPERVVESVAMDLEKRLQDASPELRSLFQVEARRILAAQEAEGKDHDKDGM